MALQRRLDPFDLWDHFDRFLVPHPEFTSTRALTDWQPKVDILEKEDAWEIHAELPGVAKEDIDLHVQNGVVTISGSRSSQKEDSNTQYRRVERSYGSFKRSFSLPESAEVASPLLAANLQDGVLEVRIPKKAAADQGEKKPIPITTTSASSSSSSQ